MKKRVFAPRLFVLLFALLGVSLRGSAHVGSPGVVVQTQAGKYRVLVSVQPPDVVPGTAQVTVFVETGRVGSVTARPVYFRSGDEGAPTPDALAPVAGQPNQFKGIVWLMASGSSSIELQLGGPDGKATVVVPVVAVATAQRTMPAGTGVALAVLGVLLVVIMVTVIGASVADGTVKPGEAVGGRFRRKRLVGMGTGAVLLLLALTGGRSWWNRWANDYRTQNLYRALPIRSFVETTAGGPALTIRVDTTNWKRNRRPLSLMVPDHGKLMHVFLVRTPGLDAFAHLHPERRDTLRYQSTLPALPAGRYLLYADVVYRSGFAETLTDTVSIPAPKTAAALTDPDDSFTVTNPTNRQTSLALPNVAICGKPGEATRLADGSTMQWEGKTGEALEAGKLYAMRFAVADPRGKPATLEPYLGMGGHAAVLRTDGSVYIHLHPVGTYSMAAEELLVSRIADTVRVFHNPDPKRFRDSIDTYLASLKALPEAKRTRRLMPGMPMQHVLNGQTHANLVEFPYAFPKAGSYRVWVQVKRAGRVLTGVFDADVREPVL
jgi:hypothetical protein